MRGHFEFASISQTWLRMAMRTAQYDRRPARANKLKSPDIWELAISLPGRGKLYCPRLQSDRASKSRQDCRLGGFDAFPERNLMRGAARHCTGLSTLACEFGLTVRTQAMIFHRSSELFMRAPNGGIGPTTFSEPLRTYPACFRPSEPKVTSRNSVSSSGP